MSNRNGISVGALALAVLASLVACSSHTTSGSSGLGGVSAPVAPAVSASAGLPSGPPSSASTPPAAPTPTKTKTKPKNSPPPPPGVAVTAAVNAVSDVVTTDCPHSFQVTGTISVSAGPVDVTYRWLRDGTNQSATSSLHFPGTGAQTMSVTDQDSETAYAGNLSDAIQLVTPVPATSTPAAFHLSCTASVTTPAPLKPPLLGCPKAFFATLHAAIGGQDVVVQWHFSDLGEQPQPLTYTLAPNQTSRTIAFSHMAHATGDHVSVSVTNGAGSTSGIYTVTCL